MKILFKAKHTSGVRYMGSEKVESLGNSKIDGLPIFSHELDWTDSIECVFSKFVFNQRPGYTPQTSDFIKIDSFEVPFEPKKGMVDRYSGKSITMVDDIIPVQPMKFPEPMGILYYFDYVYEKQLDNRLLLMM